MSPPPALLVFPLKTYLKPGNNFLIISRGIHNIILFCFIFSKKQSLLSIIYCQISEKYLTLNFVQCFTLGEIIKSSSISHLFGLLVWFETTPVSGQGLLLNLHTGISSGHALENIWEVGSNPGQW